MGNITRPNLSKIFNNNTLGKYSYNKKNLTSSNISKFVSNIKNSINSSTTSTSSTSSSSSNNNTNSTSSNSYDDVRESVSQFNDTLKNKLSNAFGSSGGIFSNSGVQSILKNETSTGQYGTLDMNDYPTGSTEADKKARAVLVAKYLVQEGGYSKAQAAALAGTYWDENGCDPGEVMNDEKNKSGGTQSYGAGIASWTGSTFKNQCLNDAGLSSGTPIESLSMKQQCDMVIASGNGSQKTYYNALKRCTTIEDATATAVVLTGGVGFSSHWSTHPTVAEAQYLSEWYGNRNDNIYGYSAYHHNLYSRRLEKAKEVYAEL